MGSDTLFPTKDNVSEKPGEDGKPSTKQPGIEDFIVRGRSIFLEHADKMINGKVRQFLIIGQEV